MEKKVTEYKTLRYDYPVDLDKEVNQLIKEGWQPHGAQTTVTITLNKSGGFDKDGDPRVLHTQAMVKYHESRPLQITEG